MPEKYKPNSVVLDPFCGSGSTLVAAKSTAREYLGFEIDPDAYKVAQERLAPDIFDAAKRGAKDAVTT